jgi:hypothetical protein
MVNIFQTKAENDDLKPLNDNFVNKKEEVKVEIAPPKPKPMMKITMAGLMA